MSLTVMFASEMRAVNSVTVVQGTPDEMLETRSFRGVDKVFAQLGFVGRRFRFVVVVNWKQRKDYRSMLKVVLDSRNDRSQSAQTC